MKPRVLLVIGGMVLMHADGALAHVGTGLSGGLASGFKHPFAGFDHLLAMVSVGLWGAVLGRPLIYALPVIFPAVMAGGGVIGMLGVPLPPVEIVIALSVLVLGGCVAFAVRAPVWAASLIVATFAVFHGYAHGRELPSAADPIGYSAGFVLATGLLHATGIAIGFLNDRPGGVVATRAVGAIIAAIGVLFVYEAVAPSLGSGVMGAVAGTPGLMKAGAPSPLDLLKALPCVLAVLPAVWILEWRVPIVVKVLASWLIAIVVLAATLPFLPVTPGYLPDHMD